MVLGVSVDNDAKAYPVSVFRTSPGRRKDRIGDTVIHIDVASDDEILRVTDGDGRTVPVVFADWFAWQAFHPDTLVFPVAE
jgi:hypothetical protein